MKESKTPQGKRGWEEEKKGQLEELSFLLFQTALARRRLEDIMQSGDLASIAYWRELTFCMTILEDARNFLGAIYGGLGRSFEEEYGYKAFGQRPDAEEAGLGPASDD